MSRVKRFLQNKAVVGMSLYRIQGEQSALAVHGGTAKARQTGMSVRAASVEEYDRSSLYSMEAIPTNFVHRKSIYS